MVTAGEFCNRTVMIARAGEPVAEAARRMRDAHVGSLVVVEDEDGGRKPIGVVTDRDLVVHVLADEKSGATTIGDVMSTEPVRAWEDDALLDVLKRMRSYGVRRIPVVDRDEHLVGLITFDDLVEQLADELRDMATLLSREQRREAAPDARASAI